MKRLLTTLCLALTTLMVTQAQGVGQISVDKSEVTLYVGESTTVRLTYTGSSALRWRSYNEKVAKVSGTTSSGTITAVGEGSTVITVGPSTGGNTTSTAYVYVTVQNKPLLESEVPFIPTTIKGGSLASDTHWYLLTLRGPEGSGKYLFLNGGMLQCAYGAPYYTGEAPLTEYLWAFSGSLSGGYRMYNFTTGAQQVVGVEPLEEPVVDWDSKTETYWSGAYASMYPTSYQSDYSTFRLARNGNGFSLTLINEDYAGMNDYSGQGIIALWDSSSNLSDEGASFCFYEVDPADFGGIDEADVIHETSVKLDPTSLNMSLGEQAIVTASLLPANATYQTVKWSSSNASIVAVDNIGLLTAKAPGRATITATTHHGLTASMEVTVTNNVEVTGLCINEIQASNVDQFLDPSYNYGGWLEFYNSSSKDINLTNLFLTDNLDDMTQWPLGSLSLTYANYQQNSTRYNPARPSSPIVPAKGYSLVWFDHNDWRYPMMCPFKLDCDGGSIYVTDGGKVVAEATYPESISRCSWARTTDGGSTWGWTSECTLGSSNAAATYASERLEAPVVDTPSRTFRSGSFTVNVSVPDGATLRYTTDGSTPTATNGQTSASGIFPITSTQIFRFCAVQNGKLASPVVTRSYIQQEYNETLPVMSLVTEPGNLYDSTYGIMTKGTNGRPGLYTYGSSYVTYASSNWNQDWDRPANIEYLSADGKMLFNQEANIAICGGWSRAYEPYSFKVKGKKQYEHQSFLPYSFFSAKPYIKNKTLQMRNGGNDNPGNGGSGRFIDAGLQTAILSTGLNIDGQSYQPVHLYRNGQYAGLINMREPNNRDLVYSNYGYDDDEVDQFEMDCDSSYVQSSGDRVAFERWYDLALNSADPAVYEEVKQICDIEEFINYMGLMCILSLQDYGYNNVKGYRPRVENGKFRMVLFDLDSYQSKGANFDLIGTEKTRTWNRQYEGTNGGRMGTQINGHIEYQEIFGHLLKNSKEFRKQFVDQFCILCGSVLDPTHAAAVIDSLINNVQYAASLEYQLTGKSLSPASIASALKSRVFSSSRINESISGLRNAQYVYEECYNGESSLSLTQSDSRGRLLLNDLSIPMGQFNGTVFFPVTLRAEAPAGYKFYGWQDMGGTGGGSTTTEGTPIFDLGSSWFYYDEGSLDSENWTSTGYMGDMSWAEGEAPLGYNTSKGFYEGTELYYGGNSAQKYPTYYFRKYANLDETPSTVTLHYRADDGFALYVNGKEAYRCNLPEGASFSDYALSYPSGTYFEDQVELPAELFRTGSNTFAVEVHNNAPNSSDIYWDAAISYTTEQKGTDKNEPTGNYLSYEPELELTKNKYNIQAVYVPLTEKELAESDAHPVKVNEVSAANSIYINDYYKKDDWVELVNTTSKDIDLTGYYISDNADKPTKYQIPEGVAPEDNILPAHGHRIIWCSKRSRIGREIHASFKLDNADGAHIVLTSPDQTWSDTLTYQTMNGDETCGLYPDGASNVYLMQLPTISKANMMTMYTEWYDEHELEQTTGILTHTPSKLISQCNEMGITYVGQSLLITHEDLQPVSLRVHTLGGQQVLSAALDMSEGRTYVNVAHLPAGTYVATATDAEGESVSVKFALQ